MCRECSASEWRFRRPAGSLSNAFTSAFKELDPIAQFKATAKLGEIPGSPPLTVVLACAVVSAWPPPRLVIFFFRRLMRVRSPARA
jgi:hypothetical protein